MRSAPSPSCWPSVATVLGFISVDFRIGRRSRNADHRHRHPGHQPGPRRRGIRGRHQGRDDGTELELLRDLHRGIFNVTYENQMKNPAARELKAAGMKVTLGPGPALHPGVGVEPAQWARFVAQDGTVSTEANLVFNNNLTALLAQEYFARANTALRFTDFWAVRVTSGGKSETLYPQGGKYWAFDSNAQNGPPCRPACPATRSPAGSPAPRASPPRR